MNPSEYNNYWNSKEYTYKNQQNYKINNKYFLIFVGMSIDDILLYVG